MRHSNFSRWMALAMVVCLNLGMVVAAEAQGVGGETLVLEVEGLWNESCEELIADWLLEDVDGIVSIAADHEADRVTVVFNPAEVSASRIAGEIDDCSSFEVTGSQTHEIDPEILEPGGRSCCRD